MKQKELTKTFKKQIEKNFFGRHSLLQNYFSDVR